MFGIRCGSFKDGLTVALTCATGITCLLSLRYAEIGMFWLIGSPVAGLKLLGTMCLIAVPWLLFRRDRKLAVAVAAFVAIAAAFLWIRPSHFPFPLVYASIVLSSATRISLELDADRANP
ncbi:MAG: hypothetical protein HOY76_16595 [Streptomyces sp.]|nr:hypothetical protein [Streptomyces sp.]